jgi:Transposase DDE domain group 1
MQDNGWDHALKVTADGAGLVGHAGAVLLRKAADQAGLTAWLSGALRKAGQSPVLDRGVVLVSMAAAIALGATSMSDIAVLTHLAPVLGDAPSGPAVRRALDLAGMAASLERIARARAKARAHVWQLIEGTAAGFPWLAIAGKTLTGWLVIDMDATLVTASSDKEGAAPTWKKGYGFHPLGAWLANTRECLAMLLRPGNAGSNTFTDHKEVLTAAIRQVPARLRNKLLIRVDGAGASHELVKHLLSLSSARRLVLFTCGWMITAADEDAIRQVPAGAWKPGTGQDGSAEEDKDVAEITDLMSRAGNWPEGLRWIARRVKPSRRHLRNLTDYEKKTGWKYSITCTNIPGTGIAGVPGSHHPSTSTWCTASTPSSRPAASAPPRPWACGTSRQSPGRSTAAGSSRRTSPPTWPPGPASSATATMRTCGKPTRTRSATGSGTSPPGSPVTPASAS